jgi:hypothetical protein
MPLTNPWLADPAPMASLPRAALGDRILSLLSAHNTAVVATTRTADPRSGEEISVVRGVG